MAYKQIVSPNLDPIIPVGGKPLLDWLGWCLAYAETAFGAPRKFATATDAYNATQLRHTDALPSGVYVLVWFSHYGTYNGVYKNWGHVAIYKDGKVWSSPVSHKPTADVWNSIADVERKYSCKYLGWSEDIAGLRIVEPISTPQGGDDVITPNDWPLIQNATRRIKFWEPDQTKEMNAWKGQPFAKWLSEALNESAALWQQREDAFNALPGVKQQLADAQKQAKDFGASNVKLSEQVSALTQERNTAIANLKAAQEANPVEAKQAASLDTFSAGELLAAGCSKVFKFLKGVR